MQKKDLGLAILIIVVGAVVYLRNPLFLSPINLGNTANLVGLFGIFAIGQGFVIMTGGIDLSVGSVIALLGVLFVEMVGRYGVPWPAAVAITIALGAMLIYRGVARGYTAEATAGFPFGASYPQLEWLTIGRSYGIPHSFVAMIIIAAVMWFVLHQSVFGRHLYAVGKNDEAARFSGIRSGFVITSAYVICSVLAAVAAIYFAMFTKSVQPSSHGNFYELYAIAAAVLGGFSLRGGEGSIVGVVLGAVLLQELQNLVNLLGIPSSLNFAVMGTVLLLGVLADQQLAAYRAKKRAAQAFERLQPEGAEN